MSPYIQVRSSVLALAARALVLLLVPAVASAADWKVPGQFPTIQAAVDSPLVAAGDRIFVSPGDHAGAQVTKAVEIRGTGNARITSGPLHPSGKVYGFLIGATTNGAGGDGVTITNLTFTVDFPVFSRGANDVTVSNNTILNALQGVTNRGGNRWDISHNKFTDLRSDCGGGIAIVLADHLGRDVQDNVVAHNDVSGTLHVAPDDCGGYQGTGIVLYADFRFGFLGANSIAYNRVVKNKVSLVSDNPALVDVVAFELTDTRPVPTPAVVYENVIGFNDFRGTAQQIVLTPTSLDAINTISRNLGENRGHGVHPSAFN
jgi:hypothetical protein